jgi:predicted RNase H-like HicB family nuclease
MNIKYEITIHWSEEDKSYISEIPELEGCIADGKTPEEALKMIVEVYNLWMESAKKYNVNIPKPRLIKKTKEVA